MPRGITLDNRTVFTSDDAVKLEWLPRWIAIIGSGYIGLEFADVYTALGCEVTMIEALENIMPTFDPDITKIAKKSLIQARDIDTKSKFQSDILKYIEITVAIIFKSSFNCSHGCDPSCLSPNCILLLPSSKSRITTLIVSSRETISSG